MMNPFILEQVNAMKALSLKELTETAPLMDRIDRKYAMPIACLPHLLSSVSSDYRVLEIDGNRLFHYDTLYYDTSDKQLYYKHHRGLARRYKVRKRIYTDSNLCFMEIKHKTQKGNTIKLRTKIQPFLGIESACCSRFLQENGAEDVQGLQPSVDITYSRITLLKEDGSEKVTLDINLSCSNEERNFCYNNLVIVELKTPSAGYSEFAALMKNMNIKATSISKYCLGLITVNPEIKHNNFKSQLSYINKINNSHYE